MSTAIIKTALHRFEQGIEMENIHTGSASTDLRVGNDDTLTRDVYLGNDSNDTYIESQLVNVGPTSLPGGSVVSISAPGTVVPTGNVFAFGETSERIRIGHSSNTEELVLSTNIPVQTISGIDGPNQTPTSILNVGTSYATEVIIGKDNTTLITLNSELKVSSDGIDTPLNTDDLNLGTSVTDTINIGRSGATVNLEGNVIVPTPTADDHAATKSYVDSVAQGLDIKDSVRLATHNDGVDWPTVTFTNDSPSVGQLTVSSLPTGTTFGLIDGLEPVVGDRILIKNAIDSTATDNVLNGIWEVVTGGSTTSLVLERSADFDGSNVSPGAFVFVEEGNNNADNGFVLTTDGTITVGTDDLTFTQFSGAGAITVSNIGTGTDLFKQKVGNDFEFHSIAVGSTSNGLSVSLNSDTVEFSLDTTLISDAVVTSNIQNSSSATTGALRVPNGGLGVGLDAFIGGTARVNSSASSTNSTSGALIVTGGVGIGENLNVDGDVDITQTLSASADVTFDAGSSSTNTSSGTLVVTGGVGISENLNLGGELNVSGQVSVTDTTNSTSTTTGSLTLSGGLGVSGSTYVSGRVVSGETNSTASFVKNELAFLSTLPNNHVNTRATSFTMYAQTVGSAVNMTINGTNGFTLPDNSLVFINAYIVARGNGSNDAGVFKLCFAVNNESGTPGVVGGQDKTIFFRDDVSMDVTGITVPSPTANNDRVTIECSPHGSSNTLNWLARVDAVVIDNFST